MSRKKTKHSHNKYRESNLGQHFVDQYLCALVSFLSEEALTWVAKKGTLTENISAIKRVIC